MEISAAERLKRFWEELSKAEKRVLFLDYDGTLAPFRVKRDESYPYPGVVEAITNIIAGGTRTVIISGRGIDEIRTLLKLDPLPEIWGTHGIERMRTDGVIERMEFGASTGEQLERATRTARQYAPIERVETKYGCVALHWRGLSDSEAERLRSIIKPTWEEIAQQGGLVLHGFDGGLELRLQGRDKGYAVRTVLDEEGAGVWGAYLGDDWTDEDGFKAIKGRGLPVLVRQDYRETDAEVWLRPPEELLEFLKRWDE